MHGGLEVDASDAEPLILFVDDERAIRDMLDLLLSSEGYSVVTAASGLTALAIADTRRVDLILVDLRMPGLTGDVLCQRYREHGGRASVILMTGADGAPAVVEACGANGYLAKPFNIDLVVETVAEHLDGRRTP